MYCHVFYGSQCTLTKSTSRDVFLVAYQSVIHSISDNIVLLYGAEIDSN